MCKGDAGVKENLVWHHATVRREDRRRLHGHGSAVLWFTGLSGAGKSTLAHAVEEKLHEQGCVTYVLDGDNVRHGLCGDLGFSEEDRIENVRRVGEVAKLFVDAGVIILTAFISPFAADRERVRGLVMPNDFLEIYCRCPVEVCETRDVKGHYERARTGEIKEFTGISAPYEEPLNPELVVDTDRVSLEASVDRVLALLRERAVIADSRSPASTSSTPRAPVGTDGDEP